MAEGNNTFKVEIVTPDRVFYVGEAEMIEFTTADGDIGVYKNHIPMTTVLSPGMVTIHEVTGNKIAAVYAGFAEILGDKVTLLAELAEWPEEIDVNRAEAAKARAENRLAVKDGSTDIKRAEFALRKALIRIDMAGYK